MIGGGIFIVPNLVARSVPSPTWILTCWIAAGVISFFGAMGCAELGAAMPDTGGQYVFVREAFGRLAGFLCGWTIFLVARTAQVAWLAVTFSLFLSYLVPIPPPYGKIIGLGLVGFFAAINYVGVRAGALVQKLFMFAKLAGIAIIVGGAFLAKPVSGPAAVSPHISLSLFGVAMIACLLGYDGWIQVSFVAGEIRRPQRNILLALSIGLAVCSAVYLLVNLAYLRVLTVPEIAASNYVGAAAAERALGPVGGKLVSIIVMLSIVGTLNGCFLTTPRIYFAQARDGLFFRKFGQVHPKYGTPAFAILAQAAWSAVLILSGTYDSLIDYAMFATWLFYGLMVGAVIVLRRTRPDLLRPYRMWGYPYTALLFIAVTAWFLINMLINRPGPALAGLFLIVSGVPAFFFWSKRVGEPAPATAISAESPR